ncbi:unnamed protein product [Notodromas monacha]|uniref:Glutamate receptor ionotropic, kainate 2 n=1 Tax=Notodromas monacha TaxID=399045 RepID=A0A7R9BU51_9CRUS|nr:unnamed protein product [Notodromas monacha]CAG0921786.1 unnamed protein product [Notodromas monacha]
MVACKLLQSGVAAIFGPTEPQVANHVQSICDAMDIPHVQLTWDNWQAFDHVRQSINLHPHPEVLGQAFETLIESWNWETFALLYEDFHGFIGLQTLLRPNSPDNIRRSFIIRKLPEDGNYRHLLREIKATGYTKIILDCNSSKLYDILEQAQQIGMMTEAHSYLTTTLDMHTVDLERFQYGGTNITGFRLVNLDNSTVLKVLEGWQRKLNSEGFGVNVCPKDVSDPRVLFDMKTEAALMYDAVQVFANALTKLGSSQVINTKSINCDGDNFWEHGHSLINYMKLEDMEGLTGKIVFDSQGLRTFFSLDLMKLTERGLVKAGVWTPNQISYIPIDHTIAKFESSSLFNRTLIVTTVLSDPYAMFKKSSEELTGNDRFEGFCIDLIDHIAKKLHFNYTFKLVDDGKYGNYEKDPNHPNGGYWNGMIAEVINGVADMAIADLTISYERESVVDFTTPWMNLGISILYRKPTKQPPNLFSFLSPLSPDVWIYMASAYIFVSIVADMAIADLTISYERESVVDFTTPWMNLGISILYRKPTKQPPNLFSFLSPLSPDVWIYMASAYIFVSIVLFVLARFTPLEWENPHPCNEDPTYLENQFDLKNCLWFTIGSLFQQGCDILPKFTPYEWVNPYPCIEDPDELENDLTFSNSLWHNWGSLMQQGSDIAPKAVSTRMVAGMWWFFTLIMISSYTANLAAFLTVEQLESPIESAADLANQDKIKYGCLAGGSTFSFFRDAKFSTYQKMYRFMHAHPEQMVTKNSLGVERVEESHGNYAFLMESTSIEYVVERRCKLAQVGGLLDTKGYGIALAPNSPHRGLISGAILELREDGVLYQLKTKWWKQKRGGGKCKEAGSGTGGQAAPLGLPNVGGVFVVLLGGMGVACLIAAVEFMWESKSVSEEEGTNIWDEVRKELKFAMKCSGSSKPVKRKDDTSGGGEEEDGMDQGIPELPDY